MSNIDFQNGLAMGLAMKGKVKSRNGVEMPGGQTLMSIQSASLTGQRTMFEANGVVFPWLPSTINEYPYYWIRKNLQTGDYDLLLAKGKWFSVDEDTFNHNDAYSVQKYRIAIDDLDTAMQWLSNGSSTVTNWGNEPDRFYFWSNHDILNGSADATEICFEGSTPVLQII